MLGVGEGDGRLLQCSCLGNPTDRGAWGATVHGVSRVRRDRAAKPPPPQLMYNGVLISVVQQSDSLTHTHTLTHTFLFALWFVKEVEYHSLCFTVGPSLKVEW